MSRFQHHGSMRKEHASLKLSLSLSQVFAGPGSRRSIPQMPNRWSRDRAMGGVPPLALEVQEAADVRGSAPLHDAVLEAAADGSGYVSAASQAKRHDVVLLGCCWRWQLLKARFGGSP